MLHDVTIIVNRRMQFPPLKTVNGESPDHCLFQPVRTDGILAKTQIL